MNEDAIPVSEYNPLEIVDCNVWICPVCGRMEQVFIKLSYGVDIDCPECNMSKISSYILVAWITDEVGYYQTEG
jgi:rubredoxin